jgi:hypothetical protein
MWRSQFMSDGVDALRAGGPVQSNAEAALRVAGSLLSAPVAANREGDVLDQAIHRALGVLNSERNRDLLGNQRISA